VGSESQRGGRAAPALSIRFYSPLALLFSTLLSKLEDGDIAGAEAGHL
jgi:hypothetical protein